MTGRWPSTAGKQHHVIQDTSETTGAVKEEVGAFEEPGAKAGLQDLGVHQASHSGAFSREWHRSGAVWYHRSLCSWESDCGQTGRCWRYSQETEASLLPPMEGRLLASLMTVLAATSCRGKGGQSPLPRQPCVSQRAIWCLFPLFLGDYLKSTTIIIFKTN